MTSSSNVVIDLITPPASPNSERTKMYDFICSRRDVINTAQKEVNGAFKRIRVLERQLLLSDSTEEASEDFLAATSPVVCSICHTQFEEDTVSSSGDEQWWCDSNASTPTKLKCGYVYFSIRCSYNLPLGNWSKNSLQAGSSV